MKLEHPLARNLHLKHCLLNNHSGFDRSIQQPLKMDRVKTENLETGASTGCNLHLKQ
jgi:hypothetical protein